MSGICRALTCGYCCQEEPSLYATAEEAAAHAWTKKWRDVIAFVRTTAQSRRHGRHKTDRDAIFESLMQLYGHESFDEALRMLYDVYEVSPPVVLQHIPQLTTFLLYGRMPLRERLEAFLLDKCEKSMHFAHRMYFFVNSFAPNVQYTSQLCGAVRGGENMEPTSLIVAIQIQGSFAATRVAQSQISDKSCIVASVGAAKADDAPIAAIPNTGSVWFPKSASQLSSLEQRAASALVTTTLQSFPHTDAHAIATATSTPSDTAAMTVMNPVKQLVQIPESGDGGAVESKSGVLVDNFVRHSPIRSDMFVDKFVAHSPMRSDAIAVSIPSEVLLDRLPSAGDVAAASQYNAFYDTPAICNELIRISYQLMTHPQAGRNEMLRLALGAVNARFLPSKTAYVPVGNMHNRLIRIHPDNSFCFKTKERVPYMVVFEVVDYANRAGGSLDESDSDDDDTTRMRAHRLRGALLPPSGSRSRSNTIEAAADAAAAAAALVRTAAGAITGRAQAFRSYMMRQFNDVRHRENSLSDPLATVASGDGVDLRESAAPPNGVVSPTARKGSEVELPLKLGKRVPSYHSVAFPLVDANDQGSMFGRSRVSSADGAHLEASTRLLGSDKSKSSRQKRDRFPNVSRSIQALQLQQSSASLDRPLIEGGGQLSRPDSCSILVEGTLGQWADLPRTNAGEAHFVGTAYGFHSPSEALFHEYQPPVDASPLVDLHTIHNGIIDGRQLLSPASAPASIGVMPASPERQRVLTIAEDRLVNDEELDNELRDLPAELASSHHDLEALESSHIESDVIDIGMVSAPHSAAELTASGAVPGTVVRRRPSEDVSSEGNTKPVSVVFAERWREKERRVARHSEYSRLPGWRLMPVIVKAHDDLRQEQFASQLLRQFYHIFRAARVPVWMRPYDILATHADGGLIEAIPDTISVDALKRGDTHFTTLDGWFERHFNHGMKGPERARLARMNFTRSMAAYSIVCYILNIKDRHNGNILIDRLGHVIHIDFGFLLTNSPGGNMNFEAAPFKLTQDFVQVMGGPRSTLFATFRKLCIQSFLAARKYRERIILLVEMMLSGNRDLNCFLGGERAVIDGLRARFHEHLNDSACVALVHGLIDSSLDNWRTRWYDAYQRWAQGVF